MVLIQIVVSCMIEKRLFDVKVAIVHHDEYIAYTIPCFCHYNLYKFSCINIVFHIRKSLNQRYLSDYIPQRDEVISIKRYAFYGALLLGQTMSSLNYLSKASFTENFGQFVIIFHYFPLLSQVWHLLYDCLKFTYYKNKIILIL